MSDPAKSKLLDTPDGHSYVAQIPFSASSLEEEAPCICYPKSKAPSRLRWASLAWGVALAIAMLGPTAALSIYIFAIHGYQVDVDKGIIYTGARFNVITSLSNIVSKVSDLALVPIVTMMASIMAAEWFRASEDFDGRGRPTPVHLGAAMSLLGGPNPRTLWGALRIWWGQGATARHAQVQLPKKLRLSIFLCTWLLILHYGISVLDQALHWTTHPHSLVERAAFSNEEFATMTYSRPFNDTRCAEWKADADYAYRESYIKDSCGLDNGSNNLQYIDLPEGSRTLSNSSETNAVAWANDGSAIMVPASSGNVSFSAGALGIKSTCKSITKQCVSCQADGTCTGGTGTSMASIKFTCPNLNTTSADPGTLPYVDGLIDPATGSSTYSQGDQPNDFFSGLASTNPFRYAFVGETFAYFGVGNSSSSELVGDTGFINWGHQGGLNVVDCQVNVVDVLYEYFPPSTYVIKSSSPSSLLHTQYLSRYVPAGATVTTAVEGAGARPGSMSFADAAALELSKRTVAGAAILFDAQPVMEVLGHPIIGSTVKLYALAIFIALACLFGLTAICVGIAAATALNGIKSPLVSLIRQRLLSPYGVLLDLYGRPSNREEDLLSDSLTKMFDATYEGDRLVIRTSLEGGKWQVRSHRQEQAL
ncbi:unnamed protein product [Sympodiomycopsis kandeliae]